MFLRVTVVFVKDYYVYSSEVFLDFIMLNHAIVPLESPDFLSFHSNEDVLDVQIYHHYRYLFGPTLFYRLILFSNLD